MIVCSIKQNKKSKEIVGPLTYGVPLFEVISQFKGKEGNHIYSSADNPLFELVVKYDRSCSLDINFWI